jgi:hypothetical protein
MVSSLGAFIGADKAENTLRVVLNGLQPYQCVFPSTRRVFMSRTQSASDVLMIRPVRFAGNEQTAGSNKFQQLTANNDASVQTRALAEFDAVAHALDTAGVNVHVFDDSLEPHTPDSIFPNNWVSFHDDGTVVLYPMLAENRRLERRVDVLEALSAQHGFNVTRVIDLSHHESNDKFLEGTGSLVLDRINRIAYACISPRTDVEVLGDFSQRLDYDVVAFEACDRNGVPIYHTNVVMSVGTGFAVVCSPAIREDKRAAVLDALHAGGRIVVELSLDQMENFAANVLELRSASGERVLAISARALRSLNASQDAALREQVDRIVAPDISVIETLGGGGVRCMLAEIFLKRKAP